VRSQRGKPPRRSLRAVWLVPAVAATLAAACAQSQAQVFDVINGNASGPGWLKQAVIDANASGQPATIQIDVPSINLGSHELQLLNSASLTTTVGTSQIVLPSTPATGDPYLLTFITHPANLSIGSGVSLQTNSIASIYANVDGSSVTVNGTILPGSGSDGIQVAQSATVVVGPTGTIHSDVTAIRKLGGAD
jgi:hypothetical protein